MATRNQNSKILKMCLKVAEINIFELVPNSSHKKINMFLEDKKPLKNMCVQKKLVTTSHFKNFVCKCFSNLDFHTMTKKFLSFKISKNVPKSSQDASFFKNVSTNHIS